MACISVYRLKMLSIIPMAQTLKDLPRLEIVLIIIIIIMLAVILTVIASSAVSIQ